MSEPVNKHPESFVFQTFSILCENVSVLIGDLPEGAHIGRKVSFSEFQNKLFTFMSLI